MSLLCINDHLIEDYPTLFNLNEDTSTSNSNYIIFFTPM